MLCVFLQNQVLAYYVKSVHIYKWYTELHNRIGVIIILEIWFSNVLYVAHDNLWKVRRELNPFFMSRLLMVLVITEVPATRRIDENCESGTLSAALTIDMSSRSVISLGRPLPSWRCVWPLFTHSFQNLLIVILIIYKCRKIRRLD